MAKKEREQKSHLDHCCGECGNQTEIRKFSTLTVKGRLPTLGRCPFVKGRCVLLSERACINFKKKLS